MAVAGQNDHGGAVLFAQGHGLLGHARVPDGLNKNEAVESRTAVVVIAVAGRHRTFRIWRPCRIGCACPAGPPCRGRNAGSAGAGTGSRGFAAHGFVHTKDFSEFFALFLRRKGNGLGQQSAVAGA